MATSQAVLDGSRTFSTLTLVATSAGSGRVCFNTSSFRSETMTGAAEEGEKAWLPAMIGRGIGIGEAVVVMEEKRLSVDSSVMRVGVYMIVDWCVVWGGRLL